MWKSKLTPTKVSIVIITTSLIWTIFNICPWRNAEKENAVIYQDVVGYYCYLPAAFIHNDLSFSFVEQDTIKFNRSKYVPISVPETGGNVIKMTLGMSYLYAPFFAIGHAYALNSSKYEANGYTTPYEVALTFGSVFYVIIGFIFLRLLLLRHFSENISAIVILCILYGTNLFYYSTTEPAMSHSYSFCLFAIFAFCGLKWLDTQKLKHAVFLGLIGGLIVLIRPVNLLVFIFPLLYNVKSKEEIKGRFKLLLNHYPHILWMVTLFFLVILPQLIFWKYNSGQWVYYSYQDEGFFFLNPHIIDGLFSYRKGWLLYTPIMVFALIGTVISFQENKKLFWSLAIYLPLHIYIVFSWWCWWYGGSFGSRVMIETYVLLALPLGVFLTYLSNRKKYMKALVSILFLFFVTLNLAQTQQRRKGTIHWDGMTKEAYWKRFMDVGDPKGIYPYFKYPDYAAAKKGIEKYP